MNTYPAHYGTRMMSLDDLSEAFLSRAHPVFRSRLLAWLRSEEGRYGIGNAYRAPGAQPDRPGFAPEGKTFHQPQTFRSGFVGIAGADLVARGAPGAVHRTIRPDETSTLSRFKLHTVSSQWHVQPVEIRGYASWINAGRPDPVGDFVMPAPTVPTAPRRHTITVEKSVLRRGARGHTDIEILQRLVGINDDGVFGPITEQRVRDVQRWHRLTVDGICGPITWQALLK